MACQLVKSLRDAGLNIAVGGITRVTEHTGEPDMGLRLLGLLRPGYYAIAPGPRVVAACGEAFRRAEIFVAYREVGAGGLVDAGGLLYLALRLVYGAACEGK